jgi:phosphomevalonate kinase
VIATAPGKLILTGEYAVLDGSPALVVAVDRRVIARRQRGPRGSSPFLLAVAEEIARVKGESHPATQAAMEILVDSRALYSTSPSPGGGGPDRPSAARIRDLGSSPTLGGAVSSAAGAQKLGLGSSAAVTVAATALALAADNESVPVIDRAEVLAIASAAHAVAQGPRGSRGSGADIAAAVHGGVIAYQRPGAASPLAGLMRATVLSTSSEPVAGDSPRAFVTATRLTWPAGVTLVPFFTGMSADTPSLVAAVQAARERSPAEVDAVLAAIDQASRAACQACGISVPEVASNALLAALALAANAMERLAKATDLPLVPAPVAAARAALQRMRGTAKTTGAGGGDIGIAVIPATEDVTQARRYLIESGCQPLALTVDTTGVDLQPDAQ